MLPPERKRLIVAVFFGSTSDFAKPAFTMAQVGRIFHLPTQTIGRLVKEFREGGSDFSVWKKPIRPRFKMLSAELQKELIDPELLQDWSHLSIQERTVAIK